MNYHEIIDFWFEVLTPSQWLKADEALDLKITEKYIALHASVSAGELSYWRLEPWGRLAEIIVLDQFSRNIYRDDPKSFVSDPMALALAQECIRGNYHKNFSAIHKQFLYMPFMHSESKIIHNTALLLFSERGLEESLDYELKHKEIIERFGRFPHRNEILGRQSSTEEVQFLHENGAIFENESNWQRVSVTKLNNTYSIH